MASKNTSTDESMSSKYANEAAARLRLVYDRAYNAAKVTPDIPPKRYYRSGIELIRMADVYSNEGSLEKAYSLYVKYMTIFLENITKHPNYIDVPAKDIAETQATIRRIFPLAEKLKKKLLIEYENAAVRHAAEEKERAKIGEIGTKEKEQRVESDDQSGSLISKKDGLRDIVVPTKIIREFLGLAASNTANNKETCGILTGKLEKDKLLVTHLLIPKQSGSSDSCATQNEEDIFDYQDQHNLITLGWIHTHPTQTAFLSSVDLHTHCSYQLMMSEAIAIVCAPKYDETGYFMLTPDHGLNFVARCKATGFHPHPNEKSLYMHAQHCKLDATADLKIIDLRKK